MGHWFDGVTAQLARAESRERRSFLGVVAGTIGASLLSRASASAQGAPGTPAPAAASPPTPAAGVTAANGHVRRVSGNLLIEETSQTRGDVTLHVQFALNRVTQNATATTTVSKGAAVVARIDATAAKAGTATAAMSFGAGVSGAKQLSLTMDRGKVSRGTMDGRAFTTSGSPQQPAEVRFADGAPFPRVVFDQSVTASIEALGADVKKALTTPVSRSPATVRRSPVTRSTDSKAKFKRFIPSAPGLDWFEPSNDVVDCTACEDHCGSLYVDALPGWGTIVFCPPCAAVDTAAALVIWAGCMVICQLPGGGCLPTPCGSFTTCGKDDKCFSFQGGRLCCPAPAALCKDICCGTDVHTCAPDGRCGCTSDQKPCGSDCCDAGETCIHGVCCAHANATVCNGVCCPPGQVCHHGTCCASNLVCGSACCDELSSCGDPKASLCCGFAQPFCGGKCCPAGQTCINGKCCEPAGACGSICCPSGQTCSDPVHHTCSPCQGKTVPCLPPEGPGMCCPANVACCAGTCCQPGQVCNFKGVVDGKNTYACGAVQQPH